MWLTWQWFFLWFSRGHWLFQRTYSDAEWCLVDAQVNVRVLRTSAFDRDCSKWQQIVFYFSKKKLLRIQKFIIIQFIIIILTFAFVCLSFVRMPKFYLEKIWYRGRGAGVKKITYFASTISDTFRIARFLKIFKSQ